MALAQGRNNNNNNNPTKGFVEVPLSKSNIKVQCPYDLSKDQRYSYKDGIHTLKVYSTDNPLSKGSPTKPRSEVRIQGHDYTSGVWQFQGHGYVPRGTTGVSIMQVFGASTHATTLQLRVYDEAGKVKVYFDDRLIYQAPGHGRSKFYFKFGVYAQNDDSHFMESRWKEIKIFKKK
ncbi:Citrate-binding protein [Linum perenne]